MSFERVWHAGSEMFLRSRLWDIIMMKLYCCTDDMGSSYRIHLGILMGFMQNKHTKTLKCACNPNKDLFFHY